MQATTQLPEHYRQGGAIDLGKDKRAVIWLNVAGAILLVVFGVLFLYLTALLRDDISAISFQFSLVTGLQAALIALALIVLQIVLHELIHGAVFWLVTGARPTFGFKGLYAFAGLPDWYLPRNKFLVATLAPLVVITLIGTLLLAVVPAGWVLGLLLVIVSNAAGAVGDMMAAGWLLSKPKSTMVNDTGDALTIFLPG